MTFIDKLKKRWQSTFLCVGLDPDPKKLPAHLASEPDPIFAFNRAIIDATSDLVCAFKPNVAFYGGAGHETSLERTIDYIRQHAPEVAIILDSKRGDIANSAELYAREAFDRYGADSVTVNPYSGGDTLQPFLARQDRGVIILCRTSNPGAGEFQDLRFNGEPLYMIVAKKAMNEWNTNGNVCLVVGATSPEELGQVRAQIPDMPFLIPGVGAQGGDAAAVVKNGADRNGVGMIINSSRGIIYASGKEDFAEAARREALKLRDELNSYRR